MGPRQISNLSIKHPATDSARTMSPAPDGCRQGGYRFRDTLHSILRTLCQRFDWKTALVWRVDEHSHTLHQIDCWHGAADAGIHFCSASERMTFARGIGFCGRIWHSGQAMWVPNIIEDAEFLRSTPTSEAGLHTAAGFPLRNGDRIVGVIEFYSDRIRNVDAGLLQTMDMMGRAIGPYLEHSWPGIEPHEYADGAGEPCPTDERESNEHDRTTATFRAIYHRLSEVQEHERRRLASQLHDQIGQSLTLLNLNLGFVKGRLPTEPASEVTAQLEDCMELVENIAENIRDVMMELRPAVLKNDGLIAALRWNARQFQQRTGVTTTVMGEEPIPRLPSTVETALFRVAQEALSNLAKHARASTATIHLDSRTHVARLSVRDDGIGFNACSIPQPGQEQGWGIQIMRERLATVAGRLHVESAAGCGTRITAEITR
ncbi:MAG TPA: GAF domain-containing sensor histidine kinase [Thiohalobacter sp.]|nr:GAF domain-containing sensor histidine kinase [Thiohalobacter sp.]